VIGGAALVENSNGYVLVGVNSFGFDINGGQPTCEGPNAAAGATRVDQYLSFIEDNIGDINTDGGGSDDGGSDDGGSDNGNPNGGENPISGWEPPLADADYEQLEIPAPATGCATVSSHGSFWGLCLALFGFARRRKG
jgi:hypothetical protein